MEKGMPLEIVIPLFTAILMVLAIVSKLWVKYEKKANQLQKGFKKKARTRKSTS